METQQEIPTSGVWPLFERLFDGVVLLAPFPWQVARVNLRAAECFATTERALIGRRAVELFDDASRSAAMERVQRVWVGETSGDSIFVNILSSSGSTRCVELRAVALALDSERLVALVFRDAGDNGQAEMRELHRVDPLTGLRDRDFLTARLNSVLRDGQESSHRLAVLFVDLNNFKAVNDRFGHLVGDRVLREAASRLAICVGEHEVVRYGGDEFVVVMEGSSDAAVADELDARIRAAIAPPIVLSEGEVALSASVGIAWATPEVKTPDELIAAADRAMYAAKRK